MSRAEPEPPQPPKLSKSPEPQPESEPLEVFGPDGDDDAPTDEPAGVSAERPPLTVRERARLALGERLPNWAKGRCGVEPRAVVAVAVVLAIAIGFAVHHYRDGRPETVPTAQAEPVEERSGAGDEDGVAESGGSTAGTAADPAASRSDTDTPAAPRPGDEGAGEPGGAERLVIDVAGEVAEPGVVTLPPGSRVSDAIEAAGGLEPGVDTTGLNRARVLNDGEHVVVGGAEEVAGQPPPEPAPGGDDQPQGAVSINSATAGQLEELPGVGPVLASSIVAHREEHGPFTTVDQLLAVSGIGDGRLADLRDRVVL